MLPHYLPCRELRPAASSRWLFATVPPSSSPWHSRPAVPLQRPCQQHLWHGAPASNIFPMAFHHGAPASISVATAPLPATNLIWRRRVLRLGYQSGAPGPDLLTRSCGVLPFAAPINISAHLPYCHIGRCSDIANLSAHLHRLPTPPPYLRQMRLLPGRDAGIR